MLNTLIAATSYLPVAAPDPAGGGGINSSGIVGWVVSNIIPLIIMFLGVTIIMGARKGDYSKVLGTVGIVIIGLALIGSATFLRSAGDFVAKLVFGA